MLLGAPFVGQEAAAVESIAARAAAPATGSVGAMSASEVMLNWSTKSVPTWGHTFLRHGQGGSVTRSLIGRAAGTGQAQGQWLNNQAVSYFLRAERAYIQGPTSMALPADVAGQVILPNGTIVPATHAFLSPGPGGSFITAFPFVP